MVGKKRCNAYYYWHYRKFNEIGFIKLFMFMKKQKKAPFKFIYFATEK